MSALSIFRKDNKDQTLLENSVLGRLARTHFRLVSPPQFSRKEPRQPLLKDTPDEEKQTVTKLWRVMTRFTGDAIDYRYGMDESAQPYLGSIMTRLSKNWGMSPEDRATTTQDTLDDDFPLKSLPNKPRGGTLRRLKATLTVRLFKNKNETIFNSLPVEDTLLTPLEHVHYIACCGILKPHLRDEIYCMICKHLVNNPYKLSTSRSWLLLELIIGCFPPSDQIYESVMEFIQERPPLYSTTLKKLLKNSVQNGARCQPPSYRELDCYQQKKPIELQITLMDGTMQTVVADGTSTAHDITQRVNDSLGLRHHFGYSIFISMQNKVASLGNGTDHVMDAISQCEQLFREQGGSEGAATWRLFYRKEMFSPWEDTSGDMIAISLTFAQVARGMMLGEYVCDSDQELAVLAARQYFIEYGSEISEAGLQAVLPSYIPANKRQEDESLKLWRRHVIKAHQRLYGNRKSVEPSIDDVKLEVVQYAKTRWPMSFSKYYDVLKLEGPEWGETDVRLAINSTGVFVLAPDKRLLHEMSYPDIITIRGESIKPADVGLFDIDDIVLFVLVNGSFLKFESIDAVEIRRIVSDVINGLRMRSVWAVVRQDINESTTDTVSANEGDLIELDEPAGHEMLCNDTCSGRNLTTGETGNIPANILYVIPVLKKPSDDMLGIFRAPKRRSSMSNYLEEGSLHNLSNMNNDARTQDKTGRVPSLYTPPPPSYPIHTERQPQQPQTINIIQDKINGNVNDEGESYANIGEDIQIVPSTVNSPDNVIHMPPETTPKMEEETVPTTIETSDTKTIDDGIARSVHFTSASPEIIFRSPESSFNSPESQVRSPESALNEVPQNISRSPESSFKDAPHPLGTRLVSIVNSVDCISAL